MTPASKRSSNLILLMAFLGRHTPWGDWEYLLWDGSRWWRFEIGIGDFDWEPPEVC